MSELTHHKLYRQYWNEYLDCRTFVRRKELESLMDGQQNFFEWEELQTFKRTLLHYEDHWKGLLREGLEKLFHEDY